MGVGSKKTCNSAESLFNNSVRESLIVGIGNAMSTGSFGSEEHAIAMNNIITIPVMDEIFMLKNTF